MVLLFLIGILFLAAATALLVRAVTLTRDTRVTNHSFVDGRAVAFQGNGRYRRAFPFGRVTAPKHGHARMHRLHIRSF